MKNFFYIIQILFSVIIISLILLQARGTGLGSSWGGGGESYRSKRGIEKVFFRLTILFCFLFLISSIISSII